MTTAAPQTETAVWARYRRGQWVRLRTGTPAECRDAARMFAAACPSHAVYVGRDPPTEPATKQPRRTRRGRAAKKHDSQEYRTRISPK
jgi:hypothetical protein